MSDRKSNLLPRGFKANAERIAIDYRSELSLAAHAPLVAETLALHLGVDLYPLSQYPEEVSILLNKWSGVTLLDPKGKPFIIYNSYHTSARQESTIMHELAHIICGHFKMDQEKYMGIAIPDNLRSFNPQQEQEAAYLGGCLQLPRKAILYAVNQRRTETQIAHAYGASLEMVKYRIRVTGVAKQLKRS